MKLKSLFKKKQQEVVAERMEYKVGKYRLFTKNNHMIDKYQAQYPLYDRFLPYFCSFFDGLIIDIGANIGDTSIAIFSQNDNCFIVGVEPDEDFFKDCIENIKINDLGERFLGIQKFVSTRKGSFVIEKDKTSSTGSINTDHSEETINNTLSFSDLLNLIPSKISQKFDLLKIDTDGFDWDILNSLSDIEDDSTLSKPRFIFFEMQTFENNDASKKLKRQEMNENYINSIKKLQQRGYTYFSLFDNFGTYVLTTDSINDIITLNEYVIRSQVKNSHSSIFYFDVMAYKAEELDFVKNRISEF